MRAKFGRALTSGCPMWRPAPKSHFEIASAGIFQALLQVLSRALFSGEQLGEHFSVLSRRPPQHLQNAERMLPQNGVAGRPGDTNFAKPSVRKHEQNETGAASSKRRCYARAASARRACGPDRESRSLPARPSAPEERRRNAALASSHKPWDGTPDRLLKRGGATSTPRRTKSLRVLGRRHVSGENC